MQAEQLRKLREQEAMEAQMQQKKRLADQMLTEWKDSLREKENRLFNLEEEITRQSVQSWAEHQRAEDIQALELAAQEITRIPNLFMRICRMNWMRRFQDMCPYLPQELMTV